MRKSFTLLLALFLSLAVHAQSEGMGVKSFRLLSNDMTANLQGTMRTDQNGHTAALIKVVTTLTGLSFDVGSMGVVDTQQEPGEVWVYVPFGVKRITIRHPQQGVLRDYYFPIAIAEAKTYEMVLTIGATQTIAEPVGSYLMMTVSPQEATVSIDDALQTTENGELTLLLPYGSHSYRVDATNYEPEVGIVEIGKEPRKLKVDLVMHKATLTVTCVDPEAQIFVNEEQKGVGNWSGQLHVGENIVEARKLGCRTEQDTVTLAKDEVREMTIKTPQPAYGQINLSTSPRGCEVYMDGKYLGKSPLIFSNIPIGKHRVDVYRARYLSQSKDVDIEEGESSVVSFNLYREESLNGDWKKLESMKTRVFFMGNYAYSLSPQHSVGLTLGGVKRVGFYLSATTNGRFLDADFTCDLDGNPVGTSPTYYTFTGDSETTHYTATGGVMYRIWKPFCLYAGVGYGHRSLLWKTKEGYLAEVTGYSHKGLALEAGLNFVFNHIAFSLGINSISFSYLEGKAGIGLVF